MSTKYPNAGTAGRWVLLMAALVGAVLILSDGGAGGFTGRPVVARDSAGVRIVESRMPSWGEGESWTLGEEPALEFGPGDDLYRVGATYRLVDGRIAVASAGTFEILIYSPDGHLMTRFGGRGTGPGEFEDVSRMRLFAGGDSLLVADMQLRRASIFDTRGLLTRTFALPTLPGDQPGVVDGVFDDGSLLVVANDAPDAARSGLVRDPYRLFRAGSDGEPVVPVAEIPGWELFYQDTPWGPDVRAPFFARNSHYAVWRDRLIWGASDAFEIHAHGLDGRLLASYRKRHDYRLLSRADADRLIPVDADADVRRAFGNLPVPERAPAFDGLLVDDEGNFWIAGYDMPGEPRRHEYVVLRRDGAWLGTVHLPENLAVRHIGADFVLGVWRDEFGVEHVRLHELIKPDG